MTTTMAEDAPPDDGGQTPPTQSMHSVRHPQEQLEVEEAGVPDENITYPTGPKLWLTMASLCIAYFLNGLVRSHETIRGTVYQGLV